MNSTVLLMTLAEVQAQGNPMGKFLVLAGIVWLVIAYFRGKKDRYLVSQRTSVRKLK